MGRKVFFILLLSIFMLASCAASDDSSPQTTSPLYTKSSEPTPSGNVDLDLPEETSQGRGITWEEDVRMMHLHVQYCFEGRRPSGELGKDGQIQAVYGGYQALTDDALTDEQLLQIIHYQYRYVDDDALLRPLPGQIQYEQAGDVARALYVQLGLPPGGLENVFVYRYITSRKSVSATRDPNDIGPTPDVWRVMFHDPDGSYDYMLEFLADDGAFTQWSLIPYRSFSVEPPEVSQFNPEKGRGIELDETVMCSIAREYVQDVFLEAGETIQREYLYPDEQFTYFGVRIQVDVETSGGEKYSVYILKEDQEIYSVMAPGTAWH